MINNVATTNANASMVTAQTKMQQDQQKVDDFSNKLDEAMETQDEEELKEACVQYETYFLQQMMKSMRKTINKDENSFIKQSNAEKLYVETLDNYIMSEYSKSGGLGLADKMYESMQRNI